MGEQRHSRQQKRRTCQKHTVADEKTQHSGPRRSVAVPDGPAAPVSAKPAGAGEGKKVKRMKWWNRLFGQLEKKECVPEKKPESTPDEAPKRASWWRRLFKCFKGSSQVAPSADSKEEMRNSPNPKRSAASPGDDRSEADKQASSCFTHQDEETLSTSSTDLSLDDSLLARLTDFTTLMEALLEEQHDSSDKNDIRDTDSSEGSPVDRFGFPNAGQSCYMNSSLQSLLTLEDFTRDISRMEQVWSPVPEAQVMRGLMDIRDAHTSTQSHIKSPLLHSFKEAVSVQAPEFRDPLQKDAHEFLTSVLDQMRSLAPLLMEAAVHQGRSYTCPIEAHMAFRMENTRTCKSCGAQSTRQEEFINLSLDLVPGGSVEELLQEYLKETELEFRCECGGMKSGQTSSFVTLPRVLILHLKRFRFSPSLELEKDDDPVWLQRDLVVSSEQGGGCYSLVSAISHFGSTEAGHYISNSVHPDVDPDEPSDCWLTFNDSAVFETTGACVCEWQQEAAYILFYKRQN